MTASRYGLLLAIVLPGRVFRCKCADMDADQRAEHELELCCLLRRWSDNRCDGKLTRSKPRWYNRPDLHLNEFRRKLVRYECPEHKLELCYLLG
jgi:hypothetical protein